MDPYDFNIKMSTSFQAQDNEGYYRDSDRYERDDYQRGMPKPSSSTQRKG